MTKHDHGIIACGLLLVLVFFFVDEMRASVESPFGDYGLITLLCLWRGRVFPCLRVVGSLVVVARVDVGTRHASWCSYRGVQFFHTHTHI